jgi:hypothetical protein
MQIHACSAMLLLRVLPREGALSSRRRLKSTQHDLRDLRGERAVLQSGAILAAGFQLN